MKINIFDICVFDFASHSPFWESTEYFNFFHFSLIQSVHFQKNIISKAKFFLSALVFSNCVCNRDNQCHDTYEAKFMNERLIEQYSFNQKALLQRIRHLSKLTFSCRKNKHPRLLCNAQSDLWGPKSTMKLQKPRVQSSSSKNLWLLDCSRFVSSICRNWRTTRSLPRIRPELDLTFPASFSCRSWLAFCQYSRSSSSTRTFPSPKMETLANVLAWSGQEQRM